MKQFIFINLMLFPIIIGYSQDYLISFVGEGKSFTIDSVKVENITQNKSITVPSGNQLRLQAEVSGINSISNIERALRIYPNPAINYSIVEFNALKDGIVTIEIFCPSGVILAQNQTYLVKGKHSYSISGIGTGLYFVNVKTEYYYYTEKIIGLSSDKIDIQINYTGYSKNIESSNKLKSTNTEIAMQYNIGDRLKLTGISGIYSTIVMDVPTADKIIAFNFFECTDKDNNNYPVVTIGTQTWMAKNLAYLPSVSPPNIGSNKNQLYYVFSYNGSNVSEAKINSFYKNFGVLYNWPAAMNISSYSGSIPSVVQGVCPSGWHLPSTEEWNVLYENAGCLVGSIFGIDASTLKDINLWSRNAGNNESGFTAIPGGYREVDGFCYGTSFYGYWWHKNENDLNSARCTVLSVYLLDGNDIKFKENGLSVRCVKD